MSESGYWASLRGCFLFLFFSFFLLFLGLAVFIFLYDRVSEFEIWKSPVWIRIKVPLIVVGVIGFLAAVIALARHKDRMELKAAQEYALSQGWGFSRDDTEGLKDAAQEILSDFRQFSLRFIRTVETGPPSLVLFDCSYKHVQETASRSLSRAVACMIRSGRFRSASTSAQIVSRDWTEFMIPDKVDMGPSPFAQKFLVLSRDPATARQVVNEAVQAVLLEHLKKPLYNPVCVTIGSGGAVVFTDLTAEPDRMQDLIDLARRIESAVQ